MATSTDRLDDAARAGWLYYVAGNTQDQIAAKLGVSRQSAQRLVSLAVAEGLVKVRIDHPIAACLELARDLSSRYKLKLCEVVPTDPASPAALNGIARAGAAEMERWLTRSEPLVMAIGTGRSLKAAIEQLPRIDCPQHRLVSLTGTIAPDGSTAHYNVLFTLSDRVTARSFPLPFPVLASSAGERDMLHSQSMIRPTIDLAAHADVTFIGIGDLAEGAPLVVDGFLSAPQLASLRAAGAVGEILGWSFDRNGRLLEDGLNDRVASAPIPDRSRSLVVAIANGQRKIKPIRAAIEGGLINGLITDEATAGRLLTP
jgi:DNA-binding transcriptional regulator LsrR (DeoR family)